LGLWVAPPQGMQAAAPGQAIEAVVRRSQIPLDHLLFLQQGDLTQESVAISPALVRFSQIPKRRPHQQLSGPKQEGKKLFSLGLHTTKICDVAPRLQQSFVTYGTKGCTNVSAQEEMTGNRVLRRAWILF